MEGNAALKLLVDLRLGSIGTVVPYCDKVRDRDDGVGLMRCKKSGVIILNSTKHLSLGTYRDYNPVDREETLLRCKADNSRQAKFMAPMVRNKTWMDVGAGAGGTAGQKQVRLPH